jgi:hypothetical protein
MASQAHRLSIFSQSLDRAAFLAYFLGAVVPFVAFAFVLHQFVLPDLPEGPARQGLIALTVSVGVLSAAAFLVLRRVTWQTVGRMRGDNERLEALLETSGRLAAAPHESEVAARAAACALRLGRARAAFFVSGAAGAPPKLEASAGETALFAGLEAQLGALLARALDEGRPVLWGGDAPERFAGAVVPVEQVGALAVVAAAESPFDPADLGSLATLAALASMAARRAELADAQRNFFVHVTDMLVAALDTRMDLQAGHARRVAELANRLGRELGLDDARRQRLHFASLLHDVGMLRLDPRRMQEPKANRQHPTLGFRMLSPIQFWADIAPMVLHHHEWFDGGGYPDGLVGDDIPLESRIIGLAEAVDSMTSASSYKEPVAHDEAVRRVEAGSGTQFDPSVVRAFLELERRGELA